MGRGLSDLQRTTLIAVHDLEQPGTVAGSHGLRADIRAVATRIYGHDTKDAKNRAAFARAVTRLERRGLLRRLCPALAVGNYAKAKWLMLTDKARSAYRLAPGLRDTTLTDSGSVCSMGITDTVSRRCLASIGRFLPTWPLEDRANADFAEKQTAVRARN